jgi:hypothetical protein
MADSPSNGQNGRNAPLNADALRVFLDGKRIEKAVRESLRDVRILHKKMGVGLVGSESGRIIEVPAEQIQIDETPTH